VNARTIDREQLHEEYTIDTPENVSFGYAVAGIGSRFIAALADSMLLGLILVVLNLAIFLFAAAVGNNSPATSPATNPIPDWFPGLIVALYALLNFAIVWGYYLLFEWLWQGQTPGKRAIHLRVVRIDGSPVSFVPVAVRNLVRIIDFLPVGYGVGVTAMFSNRHSRRLGDFAAGTLVIKEQHAVTLDTLLTPTPAAAPRSTDAPPNPVSDADLPPLHDAQADWSGIRRLAAADYELVRETLARYQAGSLDKPLLERVAHAIATKIGRPPSSELDPSTFLADVAVAYGRWVR
jgi:uncharacterized RDD family membrane protein YckC